MGKLKVLRKLFQKLVVSKGIYLRQSHCSLSAESEMLLGEARYLFSLCFIPFYQRQSALLEYLLHQDILYSE